MKIIDFHIHPFLSSEDYLSFFPESFQDTGLNMLIEDMDAAKIT